MSLLASFNFVQWIVALGIIGVCGLLILVILVQQASGGGLVGAFGGGGSGGAFGAKTGDIFTVITVALASLFLLLAVIGNYVFRPPGTSVTPAVVASPSVPLDLPSPAADVPGESTAPESAPAGSEAPGDGAVPVQPAADDTGSGEVENPSASPDPPPGNP